MQVNTLDNLLRAIESKMILAQNSTGCCFVNLTFFGRIPRIVVEMDNRQDCIWTADNQYVILSLT